MAIDREVVASAVVLRDVHCALLRAIEGQRLATDALPPATAQLILPPEAKASQAQWCDRAVTAIFRSQEPVDQDAWVLCKLSCLAKQFQILLSHESHEARQAAQIFPVIVIECA